LRSTSPDSPPKFDGLPTLQFSRARQNRRRICVPWRPPVSSVDERAEHGLDHGFDGRIIDALDLRQLGRDGFEVAIACRWRQRHRSLAHDRELAVSQFLGEFLCGLASLRSVLDRADSRCLVFETNDKPKAVLGGSGVVVFGAEPGLGTHNQETSRRNRRLLVRFRATRVVSRRPLNAFSRRCGLPIGTSLPASPAPPVPWPAARFGGGEPMTKPELILAQPTASVAELDAAVVSALSRAGHPAAAITERRDVAAGRTTAGDLAALIVDRRSLGRGRGRQQQQDG
jgi:hypothetical protein